MKNKKLCFIITPIGNETSDTRCRTDSVIDGIIKPVIDADYEIKVAHRIFETGSINMQIMNLIYQSDLVIADLTETNPNVMYELALRHTLGSPCIIIAEEGTKLPFDIANERTFFYRNDISGSINARNKLENCLMHIDYNEKKSASPIHNFIGTENILNKIMIYSEGSIDDKSTSILSDGLTKQKFDYSIGRSSRIDFCNRQLPKAKNSIFVSSPAMTTTNAIAFMLADVNPNVSITLAMLDYSNDDNKTFIKKYFGLTDIQLNGYVEAYLGAIKHISSFRDLNDICLDIFFPPYYATVDYKEESEFSSIQSKHYSIDERKGGVSIYTITTNAGTELFDLYREQILLIEKLNGKLSKTLE